MTIVNEVGLDPGLDHLLAIECFDEVHQAGGKVQSFVSYCGGLPAPEHSDNALRYKFSWSPRGALLNTLSASSYLWDSQVSVDKREKVKSSCCTHSVKLDLIGC